MPKKRRELDCEDVADILISDRHDGAASFAAGLSPDDNPHSPASEANSDRRKAWFDGYYSARTELVLKKAKDQRLGKGK